MKADFEMKEKKTKTYDVKSVKYNFLMNIILKVSMFLFPLITFPYVSRVLGPGGTGKVSLATSVISYATMFATLGIPTYGIRACAQCRDDKKQLSKTVHELLIICILGLLVTYTVLIIVILCVPKLSQEKTLFFLMSSSLVLSSIGVEWFYQGIEQYKYITIRNIVFKFIALLMMFIFIHSSEDYILYGGITVLGTVGSNFLNLFKLRDYITLKPFKNYNIKKHIRPSLNFFLLTVASTIYSNLDTAMIGFITNNEEVGYYNASVKVRSILLSLVNALSTVLLPRISSYIKDKAYENYNKIINTSINIILFLSIPLTAFFIVESENTILLLAGKDYTPAIASMVIIMPTLIVAGLNNLTGIQVLGSMGLEKYTVISTSSAAIIDIILNSALIPVYGASGAAFSTLIAEIFAFIIQLYFIYTRSKKEIVIKFDFVNISKIIIATFLGTVFALLLRNALSTCSIMLSFICSAFVFGLIYIGVLLIVHEEICFKYGISFAKSLIQKISLK